MAYPIPDDVDAAAMVGTGSQALDDRVAVLRIRPGRGATLRLRAGGVWTVPVDRPATIADQGAAAGTTAWDEVRLPVGDAAALAEEIASHGPDVVVQEPADLRAAVVRLLRGASRAATRSRRRAGTRAATGTRPPAGSATR
jgi:hypothetical protein